MTKYLILILIIIAFFPLTKTYAMTEIELDCLDKGKVTIFHTNYRISTMKSENDFYVSPSPVKKIINGSPYNIYPFLNGDTYINDAVSSSFHLIIFNDGEKVKCQRLKTRNIYATKLSIVK